jgi:hypothetical protein
MNPSQKDYLTQAWSELLSRFRELGARGIDYEVKWDEVATNIGFASDFLTQIIGKHQQLCETIIKELESPSKLYEFYINLMDQLYGNLYHFRKIFLSWFAAAFHNRLVHYLFVHDLLSTLSEKYPGLQNVHYIIGPTGAIQTERFGVILAGRAVGLLDPQLKAYLTNTTKEPIHGIECDPGESLDRQVILGHELFHILLWTDEDYLHQVRAIYNNSHVRTVFNSPYFSEGHIVELFCDFGAAWHFGPAYGKAFMEEVLHYTKLETRTHPSRITRLRVILDALSGKLKSPYLDRMRRYSRERAQPQDRFSREDVKVLTREFRRLLKQKNIPRYIPKDAATEMELHIRENIPIIYQDIRAFLNNLPPDKKALPKRQQTHYDDFLRESVRKSVMWRQFTQAMKDLKMHPLLAPTFLS